MKKSVFILFVFLLLGGLWFWGGGKDIFEALFISKKQPLVKDPSFQLFDLHGKEIHFKDFKGTIAIVNFWASWCPPCAEELPSLLNLIRQMNGKVKLIAISLDTKKENILTFLKSYSLPANVFILWDPTNAVARKYGTFKLPESYVFSSTQKLLRKVEGAVLWTSPENIQYFRQLVKEDSK
ncbi:MAG: TlpA family protein disulfide reductase [Bdellovibrio sp.]|nr:MAG: TlpA family protein disulfide reductase [Bdellovibrio sp.]